MGELSGCVKGEAEENGWDKGDGEFRLKKWGQINCGQAQMENSGGAGNWDRPGRAFTQPRLRSSKGAATQLVGPPRHAA